MNKFFGAVILVATWLATVEAARLGMVHHTDISSMVFGDVCTKKVEVKSDTLNDKLKALASTKTDVMFYKSDKGTQMIETAVSKVMADTGGNSAKTFLDTMRNSKHKCPTYIYGGAVRDTLLEITTIKDIDSETDCKLDQVYGVCTETFNDKLCFKKGKYPASLINFGNKSHSAEMVDLASTQHTFERKDNNYLEYTPNAVAYDYGSSNVFIGLSKTAIDDACNTKIGIPVPDKDRDSWASATDTIGKKIFRYWKLITKGFEPKDGVKDYVVKKAKEFIKADDWEKMKIYYCKIMYDKSAFKKYKTGEGCELSQDECKTLAGARAKAKIFRAATKTDLDWMPPVCGK